jgi:hypothetical protein
MTVITIISAMALVTPLNVGIELYKKSPFAFDGEINHHISFKITASALIEKASPHS